MSSVSTNFKGDRGNVNRYQSGGAPTSFSVGSNTPTPMQAAPATKNYTYYEVTSTTYVVKSGDTLASIAKKFGIRLEDLYQDNKDLIGSNPNAIFPGQELLIRGKEEVVSTATPVQDDSEPVLPPEESTSVWNESEPVLPPEESASLSPEQTVTPEPAVEVGIEIVIPASVRQT